MNVKKGTWVRVYDVILKPEERAPQVPEDTKKVPLELWTKGFLLHDAKLHDSVEIKTITDRVVQGKLVEVNPQYNHDFGEFVPELLEIGIQLKEILWGGESHG